MEPQFCPMCRRKIGTRYAAPRVLYTITPLGRAVLAELRAAAERNELAVDA